MTKISALKKIQWETIEELPTPQSVSRRGRRGKHLSLVPPLGSEKRNIGTGRSANFDILTLRACDPILYLLDDPELTDILIQGSADGNQVWVTGATGMRQISDRRIKELDLREFAVEIIAAGGRQLDDLHPAADIGLPGGVRVHAIIDPVASFGVAVSIRLPSTRGFDFAELANAGLGTPVQLALLEESVGKRRNILVTGGTGSGKTTLLNALLDTVPEAERIITIEDTRELRLQHPHWIALQTRLPNSEGTGEVTLDDLLRQTLRMRPDRIALGECRGAEISTLLSALNTGHDGGAGTLHARSLQDVPMRLEALGMLAGLNRATLGRQAAAAIDLVVHLQRADGKCMISSIGRLDITLSGDLRVVEQ